MKRKTKAQREDEAKAALRRRVLDIAAGANGPYPLGVDHKEFPGLGFEMGMESFGRFVSVLRLLFAAEKSGGGKAAEFFFQPERLETFDSPDAIVDMLYGQGVRA